MAASEQQLATLLNAVGTKLLEAPPSTVRELLHDLDRLEVYLSQVEQSPSNVLKEALAPVKRALVEEKMFRHEHVDVKVAVAACISEITRISAPEVPYSEDQMKEVFHLLVSTFVGLPDRSTRSYSKRVSILETVANVRLSNVMLDLELDELIIVMFQNLIEAIRDYHPENVVSSMKTIMMRVINESEEISLDLLFCILEPVKKDNMEVTPTARTMIENVMRACADKLVPYIKNAVGDYAISLDEYEEVVNYLVDEDIVDANEPLEPSFDAVLSEEEMIPIYATNSAETPPTDGSSDVVTSNDADVELDILSVSSTMQYSKYSRPDIVPDTTGCPSTEVCIPEPSEEEAEHSLADPLGTDDVFSKGISGESRQPDDMLDECSKTDEVMSSSEYHISADMKTNTSAVSDLEGRTSSPKVDASPVKESTAKANIPMENIDAPDNKNLEDTAIPTIDAVPENAAPLHIETHKEVESNVGKSYKELRRSSRVTLHKHTSQAAENNKEDPTASCRSALKSRIHEDLEEIPKSTTERKHIEENKDEIKDYGEELVGSKVKVWWPADRRYYKGVIDSFDPAKNKHKVVYNDGEVENLVLSKQRWEVINPDEEPDMEPNEGTPDAGSVKRHKGNTVNGDSSRKRLGRPSSKARSASKKRGRKNDDLVKSDRKTRSNSVARGGKAEAVNSKEEDKSKSAGKRRADESRLSGKSKADKYSSIASGKGKANASKRIGKRTTKATQSGGKSKIVSMAKSDSKAASNTKAETTNIKQKGIKVYTRRATSTTKSIGRSSNPYPKRNFKVSQKTESDPDETGVAADEHISSLAKTARRSKRKAAISGKGNNSGSKKARK